MNNQLAIVVMIDVEAALRTGSLQGNTYLVDNNRVKGSSGQGTGQLTTQVVGNQIMNWLASGIDVSRQQPFPVLESIGGEAVEKQVMVPLLFDSPALDGLLGLWWGASVDANVSGKYDYTMFFDIGGVKMEFVSSVNVVQDFTMEPEIAALVTRPRMAAPVRRAATALQARTAADGSILNPDNHVSLFTRDQINQVKNLREERNR